MRNFRDAARFYNWSEVTFPAENGVANCLLCHDGFPELPPMDALPTTVRTSFSSDGSAESTAEYAAAREDVPNDGDWINTPVASTCFYCHDTLYAAAHMFQNGAWLSTADGFVITNRWMFEEEMTLESCMVCHGEGKIADIEAAHGE